MQHEDLAADVPVCASDGHYLHATARGTPLLLRIEDVAEVLPAMRLGDVGAGADGCLGMLNLRGEMIPVFEVPGSGASAGDPLSRLILVSRTGPDPVGLLVDDVLDVVQVPPDQLAVRSLGRGRRALFARLGELVLPVVSPGVVLG